MNATMLEIAFDQSKSGELATVWEVWRFISTVQYTQPGDFGDDEVGMISIR